MIKYTIRALGWKRYSVNNALVNMQNHSNRFYALQTTNFKTDERKYERRDMPMNY